MSRADGILVCVVSRKPWEMFDAGVKLAEYRKDSTTWCRQIMTSRGWSVLRTGIPEEELFSDGWPEYFQPLRTLRLPLGYAKDRPILDIPILRIDWGLPNPEWTCGIIAPGECFRIWVDIEKRKRIQ